MNKQIHLPEHAEMLRDLKAQSYQPSNGTEGGLFIEAWCGTCSKNEECNIIADTMCYDVDDDEYPVEWIYDASGQPACTTHSGFVADDKTLDIFERGE